MRATLNGNFYTVVAEVGDVRDLASKWPCHGLDLDAEYTFEFTAGNGDLVDLTATVSGRAIGTEDSDGEALRVLSEDAGRFGAEQLGLESVLAIRYGILRPTP